MKILFLGLFFTYTICCLAFSSHARIEPRIYNGERAERSQFPWQATIVVEMDEPGEYEEHTCSGVIIESTWILSSGACIKGARGARVTTGIIALNETSAANTVSNITKVVIHDGFDPEFYHNNIGLLQLATPITFDRNVNRIAVSPNEVKPGTDVLISGFGNTDGVGRPSKYLYYTVQRTVSNDDCRKLYHPMNWEKITAEIVCAQSTDSQVRGICYGDTGGPLVTKGEKEFLLVGLGCAFRNGCKLPSPSMYTRVAPYAQWISQVIARG